MGLIVVAARVVLAGVFAVAAVAKVTSRERSQQTLIDFGVPVTFAPPLSVLLPLAEMAVAIALLSTPLAVYGAVGGLVLLVLFSAAVAANLLRGKRPDCNCFGQLTASPVGWTTLARNAVLAAIAFFALGAGDAATDADVLSTLGGVVATSLSLAVAALIGLSVIIVEAFFIRQLLAQNGRILLRMEDLERRVGGATGHYQAPAATSGLPVGTRAPEFALTGVHGETSTLESLLAPAKPLVLVFADPACGPCNVMLPDIGRWQREIAGITVAVLTRGDREANRAKAIEHGIANVLLQQDHELVEAYVARGTPTAVLIRPDGAIGSGVVTGAAAIAQLVERASRQTHPDRTIAVPLSASR